jgi:hypothetical protein
VRSMSTSEGTSTASSRYVFCTPFSTTKDMPLPR